MHLRDFLTILSSKPKNTDIHDIMPLIQRIFPLIETYLLSTDDRNTHYESSIQERSTNYVMLKRYFENKPYRTKQINLVEDIRYVILDVIKATNKESRKRLEYYHSVMHIIYLCGKKGMHMHERLRKWLDTNYKTESLDTLLMRGNFDRVILAYPELTEALTEFNQNDKILSEQSFTNGSSDSVTMNNIDSCTLKNKNLKRHKEWVEKYKSTFPPQFRKILTGTLNERKLHWGDKLIYQLLFVNRDKDYKLADLKNILPCDNIFVDILTGNYEDAFCKADLTLKIILLFLFPESFTQGKFETCDSLLIEQGRLVSEVDSLFSLHIFKFTTRFNYYFSFITSNIEIDNKIGRLLFMFAVDNNQDKELVTERWINYNLSRKEFMIVFNILNEFSIYTFQLNFEDIELIRFCVNNYDAIKKTLSNLNLDARERIFIELLCKINNREKLDENEIKILLDNKNAIHFMESIFNHVCILESLSDELMVQMMNIVVIAKNHGMDVTKYKKMVCDKFYD